MVYVHSHRVRDVNQASRKTGRVCIFLEYMNLFLNDQVEQRSHFAQLSPNSCFLLPLHFRVESGGACWREARQCFFLCAAFFFAPEWLERLPWCFFSDSRASAINIANCGSRSATVS